MTKTEMLNAWLDTMSEDGTQGEPKIKDVRKKSVFCDCCPEDYPTVIAVLFGKVGIRRLCMKCARKHAERLK